MTCEPLQLGRPKGIISPMRAGTVAVAIVVAALAGWPAVGDSVLVARRRVIRGTCPPTHRADVRKANGRIAPVGSRPPLPPAAQVVAARGRTLAHGFIDTRSPHDGDIVGYRDTAAGITQGVTTMVVVDPAAVSRQATIGEPHAVSVGSQMVWVNGEIVYGNGRTPDAFSGRALRGPGTADGPASLDERIDGFVRDEMRRQRVPGVAIGIVRNGTATARGYGYANLEHLVPVTDRTIFQSGSLGKMFTAAAVMLLVEDGRLALADPITKFFTNVPATWQAVTVRHLLTHTSGIPEYTTRAFDYRRDYTEDELVRLVAQPLEFTSGSRWSYSNTGYALLGFVVRRVTGRFYGDVLAERIFAPLGMRTTRVISEAEIVPDRAAGYRLVNGEVRNQEWVAPQLNTTADGSLYWSMQDLLAWDAAVRRRAILRPESWAEILTPVRLNSGKSYPYGFGWALDERNHRPLQQHGGAWQGFKTQYSRFLGADLSVVVLANLAQADPTRFVDGIASLIDPALAPPPRVPVPDADPSAAATLRRLLDAARAGTLAPADFAYVPAGFFPDEAEDYRTELVRLGQPERVELLERRELGDDRVSLYRLTFAGATRYARLGLAPDGRVSMFAVDERP